MFKWLHAQGRLGGGVDCHLAVRTGRFDVLNWLRSVGYSWEESVTSADVAYAAFHGHLAMLQWLRAIGVPFDNHLCLRATRDAPDVSAWLRAEIQRAADALV